MNHLVDLLCLCLLCLTGKTLCDKNGPAVINVGRGADVVLPCSLSTKEDITFKVFVWRKAPQEHEGQKEVFLYDKGIDNRGQSEEFKGRVSHFQDKLKHGDASITIRNTKISDSGEYSCYFPRLQPRQTFYIKLVVEPKVKVTVQQDSDVVLPCSLRTKEDITFKLFDWWKAPQKDEGLREVFFYNDGFHYNNGGDGQSEEFKGRVSHFQDELKHGNASIIIRNTTISDSGEYRCDFPRLQPRQTFNIELVVEPSKVITVEEGSDVVLPCSLSTKEDITSELFDWRKDGGLKEVFLYNADKHYNNGLVGQSEEFKGRVSHFQDELKHGNASITIRNTKISDSGVYSCDFPRLQTPQTFYIKLVVGAAPKPSVTILEETKDRSLLQCEVHGDPEPEVEWRDSAGNTLPAEKTQDEPIGNLFYITLRTTVTQTDHYRCVATQETINHQVSNEIYVHFSVSGLSTGWIVLIVVVAVVVFVNVVGVLALMYGNKDYIAYCQIKGLSTRWTDCLVVLAALGGGVLALMVLVNKGYIILHQKRRPKVITVKEGSDVILPCHVWPKKDLRSKRFNWRKHDKKAERGQIMFLYEGQRVEVDGQDEQFRNRVDYFPEELKQGNASIIIRNTTKADSGYYDCYPLPNLPNTPVFFVKLVVVVGQKFISVEEGRDVTLPCSLSTKEDLTSARFIWKKADEIVFQYDNGDINSDEDPGQSEKFKGRVSHCPDELEQGNASITIKETRRADGGVYSCEFPSPQNPQTFYVKLVVGSPLETNERSLMMP